MRKTMRKQLQKQLKPLIINDDMVEFVVNNFTPAKINNETHYIAEIGNNHAMICVNLKGEVKWFTKLNRKQIKDFVDFFYETNFINDDKLMGLNPFPEYTYLSLPDTCPKFEINFKVGLN